MNDEIQRKLPFSLEAEQSVLGAVLIDPNVMDTITSIVTAEDFFLELFSQPIQLPLVVLLLIK